MLDAGDALGDHQHHGLTGKGRQCRPQPCVGRHVQRRERIVEQIHLGLAHECASDRQALPLTARHVAAPLRDCGFEPVGHRPHEVGRLRDRERLPQLVIGCVGLPVAQVARHAAAEEVRPLRYQADPLPQRVGGQVAHVDSVHQDGPLRDVEQACDQADQRGLARAGAADDGGGLARPAGERDIGEHGMLGARIAESCGAELHRGVPRKFVDRMFGGDDARWRVEHLLDPLGADGGARDQRSHVGGKHDSHQDLHEVGEEGDQRPDLQVAGVDPIGTEPDHRDAGDVDDHDHGGKHQAHQSPAAQCGTGELVVADVEALGLVGLADERAHDANSGDLLSQDAVDVVGAFLHASERRYQARDDGADGQHQHWNGYRQDPREFHVLAQRHHDPARGGERRCDQQRAGHLDERLHLLCIVGHAGDQCRWSELGYLAGGELGDLVEQRAAHVAPEAGGDLRAVEDGGDREADLDQADEQHQRAVTPDVAGVAGGHALVDDVGVERGKGERRCSLDSLQEHDRDEQRPVAPKVRAQESNQHEAAIMPPIRAGTRTVSV